MSRRERALAKLSALLETPDYSVNSRLPAERDLSLQLGESRSALREALEVLEARGKIWRHVGQGTFVGSRPAPEPAALDLITAFTSPSEVLETRLLVEPLLARLAASRATEAEVEAMQRLLEKSEAARDAKTWELWDGRLHRAVAEAAHNGLLLSIFDAVNAMRRQAKWGALRQAALTPARHAAYCAHHRAYVAAIAARDPVKAETVMRKHIEAVRDGLLGVASAAAE
jgi:DNA-binding FadR family transcriptional regulator